MDDSAKLSTVLICQTFLLPMFFTVWYSLMIHSLYILGTHDVAACDIAANTWKYNHSACTLSAWMRMYMCSTEHCTNVD